MKLEIYNCLFFFFFPFKAIHIQSAGQSEGPINETCLNIQKLVENRSNDNETSGSGMSLSKVPFLKICVVKEESSCVSKFFSKFYIRIYFSCFC